MQQLLSNQRAKIMNHQPEFNLNQNNKTSSENNKNTIQPNTNLHLSSNLIPSNQNNSNINIFSHSNSSQLFTNTPIAILPTPASIPDFSNPVSRQDNFANNPSQKIKDKKKSTVNSNIRQTSLFQSQPSLSEVAATSIRKSQKIIKISNQTYRQSKFKAWLRELMQIEAEEIQQIKDKKQRQKKIAQFKQIFRDNQTQLYEIYINHAFQQDITDEQSDQQQVQFPEQLLVDYTNKEDLEEYFDQIYNQINGPLGAQFDYDPTQFYKSLEQKQTDKNLNKRDEIDSNKINKKNEHNQTANPHKVQIRSKNVKKTGKKQDNYQYQYLNPLSNNYSQKNLNKQNTTDQYQNLKKLLLEKQDQLLKNQELQNRKRNQQAKRKIDDMQRRNKTSQFDQILGGNIKKQQSKQQPIIQGGTSLAEKFTQNLRAKEIHKMSQYQLTNKSFQIKNPFQNLIKSNKQVIQKQIDNRNKQFSQKIINVNHQLSYSNNFNHFNSALINNNNFQVSRVHNSIQNHTNKPFQYNQRPLEQIIKNQRQVSNIQFQKFLVPQQLQPYDFTKEETEKQQQKKINNLQRREQSDSNKKNIQLLQEIDKRSQMTVGPNEIQINRLKDKFNINKNLSDLESKKEHYRNNTGFQLVDRGSEAANTTGFSGNNLRTTNATVFSGNNQRSNALINKNGLSIPPNLPANIASSQRQDHKLPVPIQQNNNFQRSLFQKNQEKSETRTFFNLTNHLKQISQKQNVNLINQQSLNSSYQFFNQNNRQAVQTNLQTRNNMNMNNFNRQNNNSSKIENPQLKYNGLNQLKDSINNPINSQRFSSYPQYNKQYPLSRNHLNQSQASNLDQNQFQTGILKQAPDCKEKKEQINIFKQYQKYHQLHAKDFYQKVVCSASFGDFVQSCFSQIKIITRDLLSQKNKCLNYQQRYKRSIAVSQKIKQINLSFSSNSMLQKSLKYTQSQQKILQNTVKSIGKSKHISQLQQKQHKICQFLQMVKNVVNRFDVQISNQKQRQKLTQKSQTGSCILQLYSTLSLIEDQIKLANQQLDAIEIQMSGDFKIK